MQGINKSRAKADAYRKSGVAESIKTAIMEEFGIKE